MPITERGRDPKSGTFAQCLHFVTVSMNVDNTNYVG